MPAPPIRLRFKAVCGDAPMGALGHKLTARANRARMPRRQASPFPAPFDRCRAFLAAGAGTEIAARWLRGDGQSPVAAGDAWRYRQELHARPAGACHPQSKHVAVCSPDPASVRRIGGGAANFRKESAMTRMSPPGDWPGIDPLPEVPTIEEIELADELRHELEFRYLGRPVFAGGETASTASDWRDIVDA
jgi:hypothetical protein